MADASFKALNVYRSHSTQMTWTQAEVMLTGSERFLLDSTRKAEKKIVRTAIRREKMSTVGIVSSSVT